MLLAERAIAQQGGQDSFCSGILEHFGTPATLEAYDFSPSHFRCVYIYILELGIYIYIHMF